MTSLTYTQNQLIQKAMLCWLNRLDFTHFVTLAFNPIGYHRPESTLKFAREKLKYFHANLDGKLIGSKWYQKAKEERTFFIAFPEKIETQMHYHLLMRVNERYEARFNRFAEKIWLKLLPSGTYDCQPFKTAPHPEGYLTYVTKEQKTALNYDNTIISDEFLNI